MTFDNDIKTLTDREHILQRPSMYIGGVDLINSEDYILQNDEFKKCKLSYVPGLIKICNEIIDNSVDIAIKTEFKICNKIEIEISDNSMTVKDNGTGIPVKETDQGWMPYLAWGMAKSGSNFNDENRSALGMNGVGSFATNCFSKEFIGISDDGEKRYIIKFTDNASNYTDKISKSQKRGVTVTFTPDFERFGLTRFDQEHINILKQRVINLALSFPELKFVFNKEKINVNNFKKYIELFKSPYEIVESDNYSYAVLVNTSDAFEHFSYLNGLKLTEGGTHVEVFTNNVVSRIRDKLEKRYKSIKPNDIKNKLFVISFVRNFPNAKFNSQTKEKLTNSISEVNDFIDIDYDAFAKKVIKNDGIIDPITEIYKIKEEFKKRQELKNIEKPKKVKDEKYTPSISENKYLLICEGYCLDENTKVLMSDFTSKKVKDVNINDKLLSSELKECTVYAKNKNLRETLKFKTKHGDLILGKNHRMFVYDILEKKFKFLPACEIDKTKHKLVRSKLNSDSRYITVFDNVNKTLLTDETEIHYTDNDNFIIIRDGLIKKIKACEIVSNDVILLSKD